MNELHSNKVKFSNWYLTIFLAGMAVFNLVAFFTSSEPLLVTYALRAGILMFIVLGLQNCWDFRNPRSDRAFVLLVTFGVLSALSYVAPANTWMSDIALLINFSVSAKYLLAESQRRGQEWMAMLAQEKRNKLKRLSC